ncbi:TetR/AcrR family transcriptional regulator [Desertibaculum subflavum]|uniref:TetR/AcrR family transcriptional regulator n=1 Tax=Desertibaculum subflavum TaxID=2268458 RepID=UPI000E6691C5
MPAPLIPRDEVVLRLLPVFQRYGYDGASLSELSKATGLGRSSLYHYFPGGKADMGRAAIECGARWLRDNAIAPLSGAGTPAKRLGRMLKNLDGLYAGGRASCLLGNLVIGESRQLFQAELAQVFQRWIDALAALAAEAGLPRAEAAKRAQDAVIRIQGALIVGGGLGDTAPFRRTLARIPADLLAGR